MDIKNTVPVIRPIMPVSPAIWTAVTTVPYCGRWAERCVSEHTTRVVATQATARRGRPYFDPDWTPTCPIRLGVYTHFTSADSDPDFTQTQRARFLAALDADVPLPDDLIIHADNSAGIDSLSAESPFNAVRIGLLQFGVTPYPDSALGRVNVEPVFSFHTRISLIKDLPAGTDISYGRTHQLARDSRIAILTAGYGDGVPLELSNCGYVLIHGQACPIIGRVTMDQTIVDVTECIEAQIGDCVVLIGKNQDKEITTSEFSQKANTIPWETLCSVTKRVTRVYVGSREL